MTLRIILTDASGVTGLTGVFGAYLTSANAQTAADVVASAANAAAAAASAAAAAASASDAGSTATDSANSAAASASSAAAAAASQAAAQVNETNSGNYAAAAGASSSAATASASAAATSANTSASSATAAGISATAAATSATNAANSAAAFNGELNLNVASADVTLTPTQAANGIYVFTGTLTGNRIVTVPATAHSFIVYNNTAGPYTLTLKASGQVPSASVVQGKSASLFSDANGVYPVSAAAGVAFSAFFPYSGNQTLNVTQLGAMVFQSAASVTTFPLAASYPAGAGFGYSNLAGAGVCTLALQGSDTADLTFPYTTQNGDVFFWYSDGVSKWKLGWYSNKIQVNLPPVSTVYSVANANLTAGATSITTSGYIGAFITIYKNGTRLTNNVNYSLPGNQTTVNLTVPANKNDEYEVLIGAPIALTNALSASAPVLGGPMAFADGSVQGTAATGRRNRVINGDFQFNQYAATIAAVAGTYKYGAADRWPNVCGIAATAGVTQSVVSGNDGNGIPKLWLKQTVTTAVANAGFATTAYWGGFTHAILGRNIYDRKVGGMIAVAFWFQAAVAGQYSATFLDTAFANSYVTTFNYTNAGVPQLIKYLVPAIPLSVNVNATNTTWLTLRVAALNFGSLQTSTLNSWQAVGSYVATGNVNWGATLANYIQITDVQVEADYWTPFERKLFSDIANDCLQYYEVGTSTLVSYGAAGASQGVSIPFKALKRAVPTVVMTPSLNSNCSASPSVFPAQDTFAYTTAVTALGTFQLNSAWTANAEIF